MRKTLWPFILLLSVNTLIAQGGQDFSGIWIASDVTNAPWTFTLSQDGTKLTGNLQQRGGQPGAAPIYEGVATTNSVTFKAKSLDGARTITFSGMLDGDSIRFKRDVENLRPGVSGAGLFGATGAAGFTVRRNAGAVPTTRSSGIPERPAPNIGGTWQTTDIAGGPWVFEFIPSGTTMIGTVRQISAPPNPISIAAGKVDLTALSFRILSPDGERVISFRGQLNGNEISFIRDVNVLPDGNRGGNDLFGSSAPMQFVVKRVLGR